MLPHAYTQLSNINCPIELHTLQGLQIELTMEKEASNISMVIIFYTN